MARILYHYDPSKTAAIAAAALFTLTLVIHIFQLFKKKTWYFTAFVIGVAFEALGFITRIISINQKPDYSLGMYIISTVLILLAPALYAASIYMIFSRLIILLEGKEYSLIRVNWLTKIFVGGDVVSFIMQGLGGSILSSAETKERSDLGKGIVLGGLFVQIIFFSLFLAVCGLFHRRMIREPTVASSRTTVPWRRFLAILYGVSILILIRSVFRVIEYAQGREGELQSNEWYFYVLDSLLMFFVSIIFNVNHPSRIISSKPKDQILLRSMAESV